MTEESEVFDWRHFLAGWIGGSAGLFVGHPFDTVKVLQQVQPKQITLRECVRNVYREQRFAGFFQGLTYPLLSIGILQSVYFGVYGNVLNAIRRSKYSDPFAQPSYFDIFLAGGIGGVVQGIPACPVELVKVKLQAQVFYGDAVALEGRCLYRGPFDCLRAVYQDYGVRGCFRGLDSLLTREFTGFSVYICSYQMMVDAMTNAEDKTCSITSKLFAGGMAGVFSWMVNIPMDVVKSRIQEDRMSNPKYRSSLHCAVQIARAEGFLIFWRGLLVTSIRAFPVNAVTLPLYDVSLSYLQNNC